MGKFHLTRLTYKKKHIINIDLKYALKGIIFFDKKLHAKKHFTTDNSYNDKNI